MQHALKTGVPIIGILDSGGARIQEGVVALGKYGEIFRLNTQASGVIPQLSIVMGPAAGGAVYSPALTDFVIMVDKTSHMFVTGPDVIKTVTGEDVGFEELGGAQTHNAVSGVAHYLAEDETDALDYARSLIGFLPDNNLSDPPAYDVAPELETTDADHELDLVIPDSTNQPYDVTTIIEHIVDDGEFLEVQPLFAPNILIGFGRVEGRTVGIIANQPQAMAGTLNIDAGEKAARFVRFCDAFGIPILTLVDVPGYLPGTDQEWTGVIRRGAKLLYAYAEATVPLVTVITRKAYGGAYIVMGSKQLGADINLAWPTAEIAVMGGQGAVNILYRAEIKRAEEAGEDVAAVRTKLANEYTYNVASPYLAAERGELDGIIQPHATRVSVIKALRALRGKRATLPPEEAREHPALMGRHAAAVPADEPALGGGRPGRLRRPHARGARRRRRRPAAPGRRGRSGGTRRRRRRAPHAGGTRRPADCAARSTTGRAPGADRSADLATPRRARPVYPGYRLHVAAALPGRYPLTRGTRQRIRTGTAGIVPHNDD